MNWRIRRSTKIGPLRFTVSKGGIGVSTGVKGFRVGVGPRGAYTSVGIPGTGLYGIHYWGKGRRSPGASARASREPPGTPTPVPFAAVVPPRLGSPVPPDWVWFAAGAVSLLLALGEPVFLVFTLPILAVAGYVRRRPRTRAIHRVRKAQELVEAGHVEDALDALREIDPDRARNDRVALDPLRHALVRRVYALLEAGQVAPARELAEAAHRIFPRDDRVSAVLGLARWLQGDYAEAIQPLMRGAVLDATFWPPLLEALVRSGQTERAMLALRNMPEGVAPPAVLLDLAEAFEDAGEPAGAIAVLQRAPLRRRTLDDDLLEVHYRLGRLFEEMGDRRRAQQHFRRVFNHDAAYADVARRLT